jgi:hypothetical protein
MPNARVLASEGGSNTGHILRRMLDGQEPKRFLGEVKKAAAKGEQELVDFITKRMDGALEELVPTISKRAEWARKLDAGEELDDYRKTMAMSLSPTMKALERVDTLVNGHFVSPINRFFANIYLGFSPGYAVRNLQQNYIQALIDHGPSIFRFGGVGAAKKASLQWAGNVTPSGMKGFAGAVSSVRDSEKLWNAPTKVMAEHAEAWTATHVTAALYEDAMLKMLKPGAAIPDLRPLIDAGMDEKVAAELWSSVIKNRGDVKKAIAEVRAANQAGLLDPLLTQGFIGKADTEMLHRMKYGDVFDVIAEGRRKGLSADEIVAEVNKFYDDHLELAKTVKDDPPFIDPNSVLGADMSRAAQEGLEAADSRMLVDHYGHTNHSVQEVGFYLAHMDINEGRRFGVMKNRADASAEDFRRLWVSRYDQWAAAHNRGEAVNFRNAWRDLGMTGDAPKDWGEFRKRFWEEFYFPKQHERYIKLREEGYAMLQRLADAKGVPLDEHVVSAVEDARTFDELAESIQRHRFQFAQAVKDKNNAQAARAAAAMYDIPTTTGQGPNLDSRLLNIINKYGEQNYGSLDEVDPELAREALANYKLARPDVGDLIDEKPLPMPAYVPGSTPTHARNAHETRRTVKDLFGRVEKGIRENYGKQIPVVNNPNLDQALNDWEFNALRKVSEARAIADKVSKHGRDFSLLDYNKRRGFDLVLGMIFPFQYWYSRTYSNWLKRLVTNPEVISNYARFKEAIAHEHAGYPEWWKYNVNTNELLGLNMENPYYVNIEAMLNPLNGLTGVDFNDPRKRVNWWTRSIDDIGKFGPSVWTPAQYLVALGLHQQGQDEAALRWAGRLIPQTATIKAAANLLNINSNLELDPSIALLHGGLDPYERDRVGRAMGWLIDQGADPAEAHQQMYEQAGPLWDEAVKQSIRARAGGQITSFIGGVGYKARNPSDIAIDRMYSEYYRLWEMQDNLSPDEFRRSMDALRDRYPFIDTVLMSRKATHERDRTFAYSVLGRIPPGQKDEIAKLAGIDERLLQKFWDTKGQINDWPEGERVSFLNAVVQIGAVLSMPDSATQKEWRDAQKMYDDLLKKGEELYGADIKERESRFYDMKGDDPNAREAEYAYLDADPELAEYMDWKTQQVTNNPILSQYYGGIQTIERYYNSWMYREIKERLGADIFDVWDEYSEAKLQGAKQGRAFYKAHPELKAYSEIKDKYSRLVVEAVARTSKMLRSPTYPAIRTPETPSIPQQDIIDYVGGLGQQPQTYAWEDFRQQMGPSLQRIVEDYVQRGEELSYEAEKQLEYIANDFGVSYEEMIYLIEQTMP